MLPKTIITDLAEMQSWFSKIAHPNAFQSAYRSLSAGRSSEAIQAWLDASETLATPSMQKAYRARTNRFHTRDDLMQHGRMAAVNIANQVMAGDLDIHGQPIRYAWTSIKREIHLAAFGKSRTCDCRVSGKCTYQCNCGAEFDINCDCSCNCKCHKRAVGENFSDYYADGYYDPIDRLAGEGEALRERVDDILHFCRNQIQRDVVIAIADAIEDNMPANHNYVSLEYTPRQILKARKAVAAHYIKVLVRRGEPLPGLPKGHQSRPPRGDSDIKKAA